MRSVLAMRGALAGPSKLLLVKALVSEKLPYLSVTGQVPPGTALNLGHGFITNIIPTQGRGRLLVGDALIAQRFQDAGARKSVKQELRDNLVARLRRGEAFLPGIVGDDDTVVSQIEDAVLSWTNARFW